MYRKSFLRSTLHFVLALWGLSHIPLARADCYIDSDGIRRCYGPFGTGAWFGIAIGIFLLAVFIGSYSRYKRRQRLNQANLAFINSGQAQHAAMNNQAQWQAQNQAYVPPYPPPGGAYYPTNAGSYQSPHISGDLPKYSAPPGAPYQTPQQTGSFASPPQSNPGGEYQAPQYPPPTYATKG